MGQDGPRLAEVGLKSRQTNPDLSRKVFVHNLSICNSPLPLLGVYRQVLLELVVCSKRCVVSDKCFSQQALDWVGKVAGALQLSGIVHHEPCFRGLYGQTCCYGMISNVIGASFLIECLLSPVSRSQWLLCVDPPFFVHH